MDKAIDWYKGQPAKRKIVYAVIAVVVVVGVIQQIIS